MERFILAETKLLFKLYFSCADSFSIDNDERCPAVHL